jgi:hypothetical protein
MPGSPVTALSGNTTGSGGGSTAQGTPASLTGNTTGSGGGSSAPSLTAAQEQAIIASSNAYAKAEMAGVTGTLAGTPATLTQPVQAQAAKTTAASGPVPNTTPAALTKG